MDRRNFLVSTGGAVALGTSLAGCIAEGDAPSDRRGESTTTDDGGETGGDEGDDGGGADDASIDGRLHNRDDEAHAFEIRVEDEAGEILFEDEQVVAAGGSRLVPGVGTPGTTRTYEVTVDGRRATETFTFDVETTPGVDGYVDATYGADGTIDVAFTPPDEVGDDVVAAEKVPVQVRSATPDWFDSLGDPAGSVVVIDSEERARAALPHGDLPDDCGRRIREFVRATDFARSVLLLVESAGPDLCHDRIDVDGIAVEDGTVTGTATVVDTSEEDQLCAQALAYPSVLVRVDFAGSPPTEAAITVVDGWGNEDRVVASADDPISPDPGELEGYVRPDGDPGVVPEPLVCGENDVERLQNWIDEDRIVYGEARDEDGTPTLALRVEERSYAPGDTVSIAMTNVTDEVQYTGNRHKYSLEVYTGAGWQDVRVGPADQPLGYTDEAIGHAPGEGFRWTFDLTESGVVEGHFHEDRIDVCPELPAGRYRFVFWEPPVAVAFDVTG